MRQATHPALNLLQAGRWDDAFGSLLADCGEPLFDPGHDERTAGTRQHACAAIRQEIPAIRIISC
jgi:hypothetical protein